MNKIEIVVDPITFDPKLAFYDGTNYHDILTLDSNSNTKEKTLKLISDVITNLEKIKEKDLNLYESVIIELIHKEKENEVET